MLTVNKNWFSEWFNSPYYHILYKNRDEKEAELFVDQIANYLRIKEHHTILDLPCGKGRHSRQLNEKGFDVTGLDLAEKNIAFASQFENERLRFDLHDMRKVYKAKSYDFLLNLFTSFGYFINDDENFLTMRSFSQSLKGGGTLVLDFLNTEKVIKNLVSSEHKIIDDIDFSIQRTVDEGYIIKDIQFEAAGGSYSFQETIKAITYNDFLKYFEFAALEIVDVFGNYHLNPYSHNSDRMIFILKKTTND